MTLFTKKVRFYSRLVFSLIFVSTLSFAQEPVPRIVPFTDFIQNDDLKGINAFDIEVDPRGYVIVSSSRGIFKFNGYDVDRDFIYPESEENKISYALHKGYNGDVWTGDKLGKIVHLKGDSVLNFPVPDSILNMGVRGFESVYQDKDGLLHIAPRYHGHYTVDSKGRVNEIRSKRTAEIKGFVITQLEDGSLFHFSLNSPSKVDASFSIYYLDNTGEFKELVKTDCMRPKYESALVKHADGSSSLSIGADVIVRFRGTELIEVKKFDFEMIKLFVDSRNDLWIGTLGRGVYQAKNSNMSNLTHYLEGNVAAVAESHDGGVWFKSSKIGLGYLPPYSGVHYSSQNGYEGKMNIRRVNVVNYKTFFSTRDSKSYVLEKGEVQPLLPELNLSSIAVDRICYDQASDLYWVYADSKLYGIRDDKIKHIIDPQKSDLSYKGVSRLKNINGRILGLTATNLFEIKNNELVNLSDGDVTGNLLDFAMDDLGNFWVTSETGMKLLKGRSIQELPFLVSDDLKGIFRECFFAEKYIWAVSNDGYLSRFNFNGGEIVLDQNDKRFRLITFTQDENEILWGFDVELGKISKLSDLGNPNHVYREGFVVPVNETGAMSRWGFKVSNGYLYVGTNLTLSMLPIDQLIKELPQSILQFDVFVNYESRPFVNSYKLDYFENDIRMEFDAINFSQSRLSFSFMLEGYESTWNETNYKELRYTNLSPGTYRLKFRSKTEDGNWSKPEIITFIIKAPYWQTATFKVLMVALGFLIVLTIVLLRTRFVRKKEREKSKTALELARLEMQALKAQINPHFIFNSITSAMFYLAKNENDKVESYLQRFSKLVRKVLENSDKSVVRLMEEMELIRLYVKLESEQFEGEPITFDVEYKGEGIDRVNVPPTLFQPYIENAIQHGLRTKRGRRYIKLSFEMMENELNIQIQDNGIGRVAAQKETPFKDTKSFGMLISSKRIELLNQTKFSGVQVDDLYDANGNATGTRVVFNIPFVNNDIPLNVAQ